jgi:2-oxoglutarate ferredoxin oxidoreductase subunit delta
MRGTITIDEARCKGCELCITACPKALISPAAYVTARGYHPAVLTDPTFACTGCLLCATVCPEAAITVYREPRPARSVATPAIPAGVA